MVQKLESHTKRVRVERSATKDKPKVLVYTHSIEITSVGRFVLFRSVRPLYYEPSLGGVGFGGL